MRTLIGDLGGTLTAHALESIKQNSYIGSSETIKSFDIAQLGLDS